MKVVKACAYCATDGDVYLIVVAVVVVFVYMYINAKRNRQTCELFVKDNK